MSLEHIMKGDRLRGAEQAQLLLLQNVAFGSQLIETGSKLGWFFGFGGWGRRSKIAILGGGKYNNRHKLGDLQLAQHSSHLVILGSLLELLALLDDLLRLVCQINSNQVWFVCVLAGRQVTSSYQKRYCWKSFA